jgi:thiol-disulfide isomerase/thioredoxin
LLDGDVIVKVAGNDVAQIGPVSIAAFLEYAQIQNLTVLVERNGQEKELSLFSPPSHDEDENTRGQTALGATFESLEDTQRIIVTAVAAGSPAERAGLRRDDELLTLDGKGIGDLTSAQVAHHLIETQEPIVHLRIRRDAHQVELAVKRTPAERDFKSSAQQPLPFPLHRRGEPAPPFSLPNLEGRNISLRDFQGRPVLLTFWSTWCRPCLAEADLLDRLNREFGSRLVVLGLDVDDDPQVLRHFLQVRQLSYSVLIAGEFNSPIPKIYDLGALPLTIIVNSKGFVTYLQAGFPPNSPLESHVRSALAKSDW